MTLKCKSPADVLKHLKENEIKFVDLRFTDPRGKWQHLTMTSEFIDEAAFADGIMFDGSSIAGWKAINESDMALIPDPATAVMDPFAAQAAQLILFCDVAEPSTGQPYSSAIRARRRGAPRPTLAPPASAIPPTFGPEAGVLRLRRRAFRRRHEHAASTPSTPTRDPPSAARIMPEGNVGHRPPPKGGYFPVPPVDSLSDLRAEMVTTMQEMGLTMEKHHHEVAPSQNELGMLYDTLVRCADNMQIYKYCVHMVAHTYGKTATFMPKPVIDDNGSGMHTHQSIWKGGKPAFAGSGYADLSDAALYYIGGVIKHAKALNAFTNPGTNSYKRLIPGFEAPVLLAYSARNRSAACRIPLTANPDGKRVEVRYPDPTANPYLAFAAMLMAGLDGIQNKTHPGDPIDKNLYDLPPEELEGVPVVCGSLREALESLDADRDFLKKGDVFTDDLIDAYMDLKWEEVHNFEHTPHPVEFQMYYSS